MDKHAVPDWQAAYTSLQAFIATDQSILITPKSMRIPKSLREEFYSRVDDVVAKLALSLGGDRLQEAAELGRRLGEVRERICKAGGLRAWHLPASVENLVSAPEKAASKPLFDLVLDSLQNSRSGSELADRAGQVLLPFLSDLHRGAYEAWAYLSVVEAWHPVRFYDIFTRDFVTLSVTATDEVTMGYQPSSPDKRLPETMFETADGKTIAIKTETELELDYYGEKVSREKGYSSGGNTVGELGHRVLLAYLFPHPQSVGFLADAEKGFVRPTDLTCSFLLPREMENEVLFATVARHLRQVRSLRPVQILSFDESGVFPPMDIPGVHLPRWERTAVGYDRAKLKMIADQLFLDQKTEGGIHEIQS